MKRLENKVAIITGASSGIGEATAIRFAEEGADLILVARREGLVKKVAKNAEDLGVRAIPVVGSIADAAVAEESVRAAIEGFGKIDILFNNAGVGQPHLDPIEQTTDEMFDLNMDTNVRGTFYMTRAVVKEMLKKGAGSIIFNASACCERGNAGAAYATSKGAVRNMAMHTALRLGRTNIRSNTILVGFVPTELAMGDGPENFNPEMAEAMQLHTDMGAGLQEGRDIANLVLFLASDESIHITGNAIRVDSGMLL